MIRILFVCHGNICRSPMAEYIFKDIIRREGIDKDFYVRSAATSTEEIGNPVYHQAKKKLNMNNINCDDKRAVQIKREDYEKYDYIIGMENINIKNILRIIKEDNQHKVFRLMDFTENKKDIDDPWYTGDFDITYEEISYGCKKLLEFILRKN